jgi:hypothetical protein
MLQGGALLNSSGSGTQQTLGFAFGTYGQGVYVSTNVTLNRIGIWIGSPAGGTAEFQIWNSANTTLGGRNVRRGSAGRVDERRSEIGDSGRDGEEEKNKHLLWRL